MMNRLQKVTNGRDFNLESAPSQEALSISSTLIAYIGTARSGLHNLSEIDSEWNIFTRGS